jgi:O-antigen ligase
MLINSQFKCFNNPLDLAIKSLLIISPLFFISTRGWINGVLFATSLLSVIYIIKNKSFIPSTLTRIQKNRVFLVLLTLSIGFIAILISQLLQHNIRMKPYDAPLRMVLCIPIFLYLLHRPLEISKYLAYVLSISLFIGFITIFLNPEIPQFWGGRFATTPADPNAFGAYITCMTALIFFSMSPKEFVSVKTTFTLKLLGFLIGVYLVAGSGTRGAWLSIPFLLLAWFYYHARKDLKLTLLISISTVISCFIAYQFLEGLQTRVNSGFSEVYSWLYTQNKDTSAGIRFSMWKITIDLFLERPLSGFGDLDYQSYLSNEIFTQSYSPIVIETMAKAGPHNEYLAHLLRSGIWGGISIISIFVIPFYVLSTKVSKSNVSQGLLLLGLALFISLTITALSIEIFNLKYTSSFYALMVVMLCSEKINSLKNSEINNE